MYLLAAIQFIAFLFTCIVLIEFRCRRKTGILILACTVLFVVLLQLGLLLFDVDITFLLTVFPLSAYLPIIIGIYIVSKAAFFQTTAIWIMGLFVSAIINFFQRGLLTYITTSGVEKNYLITAILIVVSFGLLWVIYRYLRKAFKMNVLQNDTNWLLLYFPVIMVGILFSYFKNSVVDINAWILVFFTALSVFLVIARVLVMAMKSLRVQEEENTIVQQLSIQQREYENISNRMKDGRRYRHDMRHHLNVLYQLANEEHNEDIIKYIKELDDNLSESELITYCENTTINAVLSCYLKKAIDSGFKIDIDVDIPSVTYFNDFDICIILANALENAIHASSTNNDSETSCISIQVKVANDNKFIIAISNPCSTIYYFDKEGYPIIKKREGHGIGLKSIKKIIDKYEGLCKCECKDGTFKFKAILFEPEEIEYTPLASTSKVRGFPRNAFIICAVCCFFICGFAFMQGLEKSTEGSDSVYVKHKNTNHYRWGSSEFDVDVPKVEFGSLLDKEEEDSNIQNGSQQAQQTITPPSSGGISMEDNKGTEILPPIININPPIEDTETETSKPLPPTVQPPKDEQTDLSDAVEDMNQKMEEYVQILKEKFIWYVARKYNGYVGLDSTYTTLRNDESFLIIRFNTVINVGGSQEYNCCFILDKEKGKVIQLQDLFKEKSEYIHVISKEIIRQMTAQVNAGEADYFIPGGIWSDAECFKSIKEDQNFYINDQNQLVIIFEEYEVAPGKEGAPEFIIPTEVIMKILQEPILLS